MALFYFTIDHNQAHTAPEEGIAFNDAAAAWREATAVCSEMLRNVDADLVAGIDWKLTVSDEAHRPVFELQLKSVRHK